MIPLAFAPEGKILRVVGIRGGRGVMQRLADLGLLPGSIIRVVKSTGGGAILLELRGSKIALGRGISMKVFVEVK